MVLRTNPTYIYPGTIARKSVISIRGINQMAMPKGGARKGAGRPKGGKTKRTREIAQKLALTGLTPLEVMLKAMRLYWEAGNRDKAAAIAKDAAPYMHPRLTSVDVGGKQGQPIETKDVTNTELARRIAFILGQAAREKAEETPLAASVASNGHQYGRQLANGEIA